MMKFGKRGDFRRAKEIIRSRAGGAPEGRAYHWDGKTWRRITLPNTEPLLSIYLESPEKIWMTGYGGTILLGNAAGGFTNMAFHGDTETIASFTKFGSDYVAASPYFIYRFNGHNLSSFVPGWIDRYDNPSIKGRSDPLSIAAIDDVLYCFTCTRGIYRFDGERWEEIPIPLELLERDFKGLPRARR
jgi:hypothetical protein